MRTSVVLVTVRRLASLEAIIRAWLRETPDVWVADCSGRFKTALPVNLVQFSTDPGNKSRHAVALLTEGDLVVKADDDVLPSEGFLEDLVKAYRLLTPPAHPENKGGNLDTIVGVIGRRFLSDRYYGGTEFYKASAIAEPVAVDFAGVVTLAPRSVLAFDLKGCASQVEDLFWQMAAYPLANKFVVPTTRYVNLPAAREDCLFKDPGARAARQAYYKQWYDINYARRPKWTPRST